MAEAKATIAGAPISWVALWSAIIGAGSIIPVYVYVGGVGARALGSIFIPLGGLVLGPFAGAIAGTIGGLLTLFINPVMVGGGPLMPLTFIGMFTLPPLFAGLIAKGKWMYLLPVGIIMIIYVQVFPYIIPGPPAFQSAPYPLYLFADWTTIGALAWLIIFGRKLPKWLRSENKTKFFIANLLTFWIAAELLWKTGQAFSGYLFHWPPQLMITICLFSYAWQRAILFPVAAVICVSIIAALRKTGLRKIPGAVW